VGDSDSDQIAALRNNVVFIEAAWGYGNDAIENARYRIEDIGELPDVLKVL
jgi:phosphoglycolate phosphatase-like HAD superfamily hydrolase